MWERLILFWNAELWDFRLEEVRGWRKSWYQALRVLSLSLSSFYKDNCTLRASSLTYYTIMSIVPILALAFSIARGFDLQETLKVQLLENFHDHKDALTEIILFANRLIEETRGGVLAGIGIAVLLWSGISLIGSMEAAMNHIWNVDQMRSWRRVLSEYLALLLIAPVLFVIASSTVVLIATYLEHLFKMVPGASFFLSFFHFSIQLVPYVLFWLFFSFLYYFLPNTRVKVSSAVIGGVISGTLYLVAQLAYIYFQIGVSKYGAVYGSFAALPLFLVWVQLSWFIFLFGAEVSYAYQSIHMHEFEFTLKNASPKFKKMLKLWMLQVVVRRFQENYESTSVYVILKHCKIPTGIALPLINELVLCGLLKEMKAEDMMYMPGRPIEDLRISDAIETMDSFGISDMPFIHSKELAQFEKALRHFTHLIEKSSENELLTAIKHRVK